MKLKKHRFIGALLSLLGFSSCAVLTNILDQPDMYGSPAAEYGSPTVTYRFVGRACNADGNPVPGVRVVVASDGLDAEWRGQRDTLITDSGGNVSLPPREVTGFNLKRIQVKFEDIDGTENGAYETLVLNNNDLKIEQEKAPSGSWDSGTFAVEADVILTAKKEE